MLKKIVLLLILPVSSLFAFTQQELKVLVYFSAKEAHVPVSIAYALVESESQWNPWAINHNRNHTTDKGLLQLNSRYIDLFSKDYNDGIPINPFEPKTAIRVGMRYLHAMYKKFNCWEKAVQAYKSGPGTVELGRVPEFVVKLSKRIVENYTPVAEYQRLTFEVPLVFKTEATEAFIKYSYSEAGSVKFDKLYANKPKKITEPIEENSF